MKQLHQTSTGTHIIEATSSELANLLAAKQALDVLCDQFEFTITPAVAVTGNTARTGAAQAEAGRED